MDPDFSFFFNMLKGNICFNGSIGRYWLIFWYQPHHQQPPGLMTGNLIGAKMSLQRWPVLQLQWPSLPSLPLPLALSSPVTIYVTLTHRDTTWSQEQSHILFNKVVRKGIKKMSNANLFLGCTEADFNCNFFSYNLVFFPGRSREKCKQIRFGFADVYDTTLLYSAFNYNL